MANAKKTLRITQVKSAIGKKYDQERTLKALGLGKIGRSVIRGRQSVRTRHDLQGQASRRSRRVSNKITTDGRCAKALRPFSAF